MEFLRFVSSNTFIEVAVRTCGIARVGLYLRDNLKKINEERQSRYYFFPFFFFILVICGCENMYVWL